MIDIQNLHKRHAGRDTLRGATATIAEGETVAVVGASGGGKSTLLRCLNGLDVFDVGSVRIAGRTLAPNGNGLTPQHLVELRTDVALVFQELHLFAHLSVLDNITLAPRVVRRQEPNSAAERALGLLERVGLAGRADAFPHELSGGQKQRVAIARALAHDPKVLLLDEPTSALDRETTAGVADTISELTRGRVTVVLVTHHLELAARMADRILRLHDGKLVPDAPALRDENKTFTA